MPYIHILRLNTSSEVDYVYAPGSLGQIEVENRRIKVNGIVARHEKKGKTVIIELQAKNIKDRKHRAISTAKENQNERKQKAQGEQNSTLELQQMP
jgi:hypothetical protein